VNLHQDSPPQKVRRECDIAHIRSRVSRLTTTRPCIGGLSQSNEVSFVLRAEVLGSDPQDAGGRRVIFVSGDDADAKADVVALFQDAGFAAIDLGDLATGGAIQQIHHPLAGVNLIRL
jgi:hypothetical protein